MQNSFRKKLSISQKASLNKLVRLSKEEGCVESYAKLKKLTNGYFLDALEKSLEKDYKYLFADIKEDKMLILWKCINSYNREKGACFTSWLYQNVVWEVSNRVKKEINQDIVKTRVDVKSLSYEESFENKTDAGLIIDAFESDLSEMEQDVFFQRVFGEQGSVGFKKISKKLNKNWKFAKRTYEKSIQKIQNKLCQIQ